MSSSERAEFVIFGSGSHLQTEDAQIFSPTPNKSVCGVLKNSLAIDRFFSLEERS